MKKLEILFLILTFLMPTLLIRFTRKNKKRIKSRKKRIRMVKMIFGSFFINLLLFGGVKTYNMLTENKENNNVKIETNKNEENKIETKPETDVKTDNNVESKVDDKLDKEPDNPTVKTEEKETTPVVNDVPKTSKGFTIENKNGVTYIDGYLIVNKTYPLPSDYVPTGTHKAAPATGICTECIDEQAYNAYIKMRDDMSKEGLKIYIASGYRSYSYQNGLYSSYVKRSGQTAADTFSARAGHSEHQSGLAFDLNSVTDAFATTKEGIWVNKNCYKYGFIIRYPKGKDSETGYKHESWHLRYVGNELAEKLYNSGDWITMESYFGITSKYAN